MNKQPCEPQIGADVEWLLFDKILDAPVPACDLVGGTKENPLAIGHAEGFYVQEDNVMVEWNVPPARSWATFSENIYFAIDEVNAHVQRKLGEDYIIKPIHEFEFSENQLLSDKAKTFGCEPDFDAYLGGEQRRDGAVQVLGNYRTCGGHIHLGGDFQCPDFVAALFAEYYIGVYGNLPMNFNSVRQQWYGQPGIFRPKPYGIEYRTPDNSWTADTDSVQYVAHSALECAEWLTRTSATRLQEVFRAFPWLRLRDYMRGVTPKNGRTRADERSSLLNAANSLGLGK